MKKLENLFKQLSIPKEGREIGVLLTSSYNMRIELVASGENLPKKWYDEKEEEFVAVLRGRGELYFSKENKTVKMKKGDYLIIPPHTKHKITKTSPNTLWLAVFYNR